MPVATAPTSVATATVAFACCATALTISRALARMSADGLADLLAGGGLLRGRRGRWWRRHVLCLLGRARQRRQRVAPARRRRARSAWRCAGRRRPPWLRPSSVVRLLGRRLGDLGRQLGDLAARDLDLPLARAPARRPPGPSARRRAWPSSMAPATSAAPRACSARPVTVRWVAAATSGADARSAPDERVRLLGHRRAGLLRRRRACATAPLASCAARVACSSAARATFCTLRAELRRWS